MVHSFLVVNTTRHCRQSTCSAAKSLARNTADPLDPMAEGVGFEPTVPMRHDGVRHRHAWYLPTHSELHFLVLLPQEVWGFAPLLHPEWLSQSHPAFYRSAERVG